MPNKLRAKTKKNLGMEETVTDLEMYREILFQNPNNVSAKKRIKTLMEAGKEWMNSSLQPVD